MSPLPQVESEMRAIEAAHDLHVWTAERALDEIQAIGRRAKDLSRQLKNTRRKLRRSTKRFCDALEAVARPSYLATPPRAGEGGDHVQSTIQAATRAAAHAQAHFVYARPLL